MKQFQKNKNTLRPKKKGGLKGYNLHAARLEYTGERAMRSIKYPLACDNHEVANGFEGFCQQIKNDYRNLFGDWDIESYFENEYKGDGQYSLLDFYVDSLRAGVIFAPSASELIVLAFKIAQEESPFSATTKNLNKDLKNILDLEKFGQKFIEKKEFRVGKSEESLRKDLKSCLKSEFKDDKKANEAIDKLLKKLSLAIGKGIAKKNEILEQQGVNFSVIDNFFKDLFPIRNPTFFINQKFEFDENLERMKCFERLDNLAKSLEVDFKILVGLSDNKNALSNYLNVVIDFLQRGEIEGLLREFKKITSLWVDKEDELRKRLNFLSQKAKQLGKQNFATNYHEYRTNFGGKIESWLSNTINQEEKIKNILFGYMEIESKRKSDSGSYEKVEKFHEGQKQEIEKIKNDLVEKIKKGTVLRNLEQCRAKESQKEVAELEGWLDELRVTNEKLEAEKRLSVELLQIYNDVLLNVRTRTNLLWMKYFIDEDKDNSDDKVQVDKKFPKIFGKIPLMPEFLGGSKKKKFISFLNSAETIKKGLAILEEVEKSLLERDISWKESELEKSRYFLKALDSLRGKGDYVRSRRFHFFYKGLLEKYLGRLPMGYRKLGKNEIKEVFFKNSYGRNNNLIGIFNTKKENEEKLIGQIKETLILKGFESFDKELEKLYLITDFISKDERNSLFSRLAQSQLELLDYIELVKTRVSWLIKIRPEATFNFSETRNSREFREFFPKAVAYLDFWKEKRNVLNGNELGQFLQANVFSVIKGAVSLYTREEFISRYVLQTVGSEKIFKLFYSAKDSAERCFIKAKKFETVKDFKGKKGNTLRKQPHRWGVEILKYNFNIKTTRYQLRFLEDFLNPRFNGFGKKQKIKTVVSLAEPSLILEEKIRPIWEDGKVVGFNNNLKEKHLFLNIPFYLDAKETRAEKNEKQLLRGKNRRYLGIDVGEYGLAYMAVDFSKSKRAKLLDAGFIFDGSLRAIINNYSRMKNRAVVGTFGIPVTKLAQVRENAIGALRNKIHNLVLKYNASPVYEAEISNFETGSGKVTKIYNSVKVADRGRIENDAEKMVKKNTWGDDYAKIGKEVSAYGTSQTCLKCGRCALDYLNKNKKDYHFEIKKHLGKDKNGKESHYILIDLENGEKVRGFMKEKSGLSSDLLGYEEAKRAIGEYIRPPYKVLGRDKERRGWYMGDKLIDEVLDEINERRGNQAVFTCSFDGCGSLVDCDLQAAFNIALRGFTRDVILEKYRGKTWSDLKEEHKLEAGKKESEVRNNNKEAFQEILRRIRNIKLQ